MAFVLLLLVVLVLAREHHQVLVYGMRYDPHQLL
jgi:hypothetical protein